MKDFVKRMIDEHAELILRIEKLESYVYSKDNKDDKIEYANKCVQLRAMKVYCDVLTTRLVNQGIEFDGTNYKEIVAQIAEENVEMPAMPNAGNDYDIDKENHE